MVTYRRRDDAKATELPEVQSSIGDGSWRLEI